MAMINTMSAVIATGRSEIRSVNALISKSLQVAVVSAVCFAAAAAA